MSITFSSVRWSFIVSIFAIFTTQTRWFDRANIELISNIQNFFYLFFQNKC